jgi:hypothetical protein
MKRVSSFLDRARERIHTASADIGRAVEVDATVLDRGDSLALEPPGLWSPNRSCRMIKAEDGWIATNLPRNDDIASIPALLGADLEGDPWDALMAGVASRASKEIVSRGELLGLAISRVGETEAWPEPCRVDAVAARPRAKLRVLDFSSLWAGPLCGSIFSAMGANVIKLDSVERPDSTARDAPLLDRRLNGAKRRLALPITSGEGRAALLDEIGRSDVLITSARARALDQLGFDRARLRQLNPSLIWIAVTGHGLASNRVAFGDDAAAAGGLVSWESDEPSFVGDALADPLTGLAAAAAALELIARKRAGFIDAALARTAAYVAASAAP